MKNLVYQQAYLQVIAAPADAEAQEMPEIDPAAQQKQPNRLAVLKQEYMDKQITKKDIADLLAIAVIDETLAEFNYFAAYNLAETENRSDYIDEFKKHQQEQRDHRYDLVQRIRQLGFKAPVDSLNAYQEKNSCGADWKQQMSNDSDELLVNRYNEQLCAAEFYGFVLSCIERMPVEIRDTTTEQLVKSIRGDEQEHAKDLHDLMVQHGVGE